MPELYGLPDFSRTPAQLEQAILDGIDSSQAMISTLTESAEPPTVENTLVALEHAERPLRRALEVFYNQHAAATTTELEEVEERIAPLLAAHRDWVAMHPRLFDRLKLLAGSIDRARDGADAVRLVQRRLRDARRAGVELPAEEQARLRGMNARLQILEARFNRRALAGQNASAVHVSDETELAGLPDDAKAGAAAAARERGLSGWLLTLQLPTPQDVLALLEHRELRRRIQRASETRGSHGDANDTRQVLLEIVKLRAERAQLLGYQHHADYVAETETAGSSQDVLALLARLVGPAVANARAEALELEALLQADHPQARLEPWDWAFYAAQVRRERLQVPDLRAYLELETVLQRGVFEAARRLFGLAFEERADLLGYADGVRVFEVFDDAHQTLGLFVFDAFTRDSKRGGAWMNHLAEQHQLADAEQSQRPIVVNNLNVMPRPEGEPTLLAWDEVITLFHEFGHALHGLFSQVRFPSQSGTNVARDFVEYPSQVNEMWAWDPQLLANYARHHLTGEPIPAEAISAVLAARQYGEGFATTEYLGAALLDLMWHRLAPDEVPTEPAEVAEFERAALEACGIACHPVPPRYRSAYFSHIFGTGYDAAYYAYIWSEVFDADTVSWYAEHGGLTRENGETFRRAVLSRGDSRDPRDSFRELRGRDAQIAALLERRGLTTEAGG